MNKRSDLLLMFAVQVVMLMMTLPFLVPVHYWLLPTFWSEWLALFLGAMLVGLLGLSRYRTAQSFTPGMHLPLLSWLFLLGAIYAWLQPEWVSVPYAEHAELFAWYLCLAAALVWAGGVMRERLGLERVAVLTARAILIGALLMATTGLMQWLGWSAQLAPWVVNGIVAGRVTGNLAQPNLYANYLVLGMLAAAYLFRTGNLARYRFALCLLFLAPMLELSTSRSALLTLVGLFLFVLVWTWRNRDLSGDEHVFSAECLRRWLALMAGIVILVLVVGPVVAELRALWPGGIGERSGSVGRVLDVSSENASKTNLLRPLFWDKAWSMFLSAPWSGVGLGGFSWNFYNIDPRWITTPLYGTESNAHNVFMHLLAETGLPGVIWLLSLPIAVVVVLSRYAQRRKIAMAGAGAGEQGAGLSGADNAMIWIVLVLLAQALHSMVEFPLWHAFFLCLLAFVAGLLYPPAVKPVAHPARAVLTPTQRTAKWLNDERAGGGRLWPMVAVGFSAAAIALLVLHGKTFWDFHRVASISRGLQVDVVGASEVREMRRSLMVPFVDIGLALAIPLDGKDLPIKLSFSEKVVHYWPTAALVHRHIVLLAQAGRDGEALALLARVRKMVPESELALRQLVEDLPAEALPGASPLRAALDSATQ